LLFIYILRIVQYNLYLLVQKHIYCKFNRKNIAWNKRKHRNSILSFYNLEQFLSKSYSSEKPNITVICHYYDWQILFAFYLKKMTGYSEIHTSESNTTKEILLL
jgi:hypothetical protein